MYLTQMTSFQKKKKKKKTTTLLPWFPWQHSPLICLLILQLFIVGVFPGFYIVLPLIHRRIPQGTTLIYIHTDPPFIKLCSLHWEDPLFPEFYHLHLPNPGFSFSPLCLSPYLLCLNFNVMNGNKFMVIVTQH